MGFSKKQAREKTQRFERVMRELESKLKRKPTPAKPTPTTAGRS